MVFRYNQVGYRKKDMKLISLCLEHGEVIKDKAFTLFDSKYGRVVFSGELKLSKNSENTPFVDIYICDISNYSVPGSYYLKVDDKNKSPEFKIVESDAYVEVLNNLICFFKSQRCGDTNPLIHKPCHLNDRLGLHDTSGGWHDAGDYIKFMGTTSYVCVNMLTAIEYAIEYGYSDTLKSETEEIPILLIEARIGIEWILKMTAAVKSGILYYQVGGEDDHDYWRKPESDDETGIVGNPRIKHVGWGRNLTGRTVAALLLSSRLWKMYDINFSDECKKRAMDLWDVKDLYPNVQCSTPSDYYFENSSDEDILLAALEMYRATGKSNYKDLAIELLGKIDGYHLGWQKCDFLGVALAYRLGIKRDETLNIMEGLLYYKNNLCEENSFGLSTPAVWGTTANMMSDAQAALMYYCITGDNKFNAIFSKQMDYLLGNNNWGVSFIVGIGNVFPKNIHSQINDLYDLQIGAVVGGPAEKKAWENEITLPGKFNDEYFRYQSEYVYFDCKEDYFTNEIAIDYAISVMFVTLFYSSEDT